VTPCPEQLKKSFIWCIRMNVRYTEKNPPADVEKITRTAQQLSINPGSWITRFFVAWSNTRTGEVSI